MSLDQTTRRQNLDDLILTFLRNKKPETVEHLVNMVSSLNSFSREEIVEHVLLLQSEGRIVLCQAKTSFPSSFGAFVFSEESAWFWIITVLVLSTVLAVTTIPENAYPFVYIRYTLGLPYVLFLPGYCALRAIFAERDLEYAEQLVLSIGLSIFITFALGLALNYLPWGITLGPIVLGSAIVTLFFTLVAIRREYRTRLQKLSPPQGTLPQKVQRN